MFTEDIEDFSFLWKKSQCYSLVYDGDEIPTIMMSKLRNYVIVETNDLEMIKEIQKKMIKAGVETFITFGAFFAKYPPISSAEKAKIDIEECTNPARPRPYKKE